MAEEVFMDIPQVEKMAKAFGTFSYQPPTSISICRIIRWSGG